jgi:DNA-binding LacI/PurR family transcriptional regulator
LEKVSVSLKQVAERAGVTGAAVSMALRGHSSISASRRKEIKRIAEEMGYKPNLLARGLAGGRTHTVGIIMSGLCHGAPTATIDMARSIMLEAINRGYVGAIADSMGGDKVILQTLADFAARRFDGIVFQNGSYSPTPEPIVAMLQEFGSAVVITNKKDDFLSCDQIVQDRGPALDAIAEYLAKTGRSKIVLAAIYPPKAEAYKQSLNKYGISVQPEASFDVVEGEGLSYDAFHKELEKRFGNSTSVVDTIICNNDTHGAVAIDWVRSRGLRIPEDVAVIGFNDEPFAAYLQPPLASVARQSDQVVSFAVDMLFSRLENPGLPHRCEFVPMQFINRRSAGKAESGAA